MKTVEQSKSGPVECEKAVQVDAGGKDLWERCKMYNCMPIPFHSFRAKTI